jgi:hypothetical protein
MKRKLFVAISIASLIASLFTSGRVSATQEFPVEGAGLEADPTSYSGPCPGLIKFKGKIQASAAGRVKYTWVRSDGATAPVEFVDFDAAGVKYVETTWTLGDASALPHFEGWQQIKILSPNELLSNQAKFVLDCKQGGTQPPSRPQPQPTPNTGGEQSKQPDVDPRPQVEKQLAAEKQTLSKIATIPSDGTALTTELFALKQGQSARLELKNKGNEPVPVRLQFINPDSKMLSQRDATIEAGGSETLEFTGPNNPLGVARDKAASNPTFPQAEDQLRAQFGTEAKLIGLLQPSLRILENGSGKTIQLIGPEGFKQLGPPVVQPNSGNRGQSAAQGFPLGFVYGFTTVAFPQNPIDASSNQILTARLALKNNAEEPIPVRLQFVDEDGKVLVQRDTTLKPGSNETLEFPFTGGSAGRDRFKAQFVTSDKLSIGGLDPSLEIIDKESGKTVKTVGSEGFKEFKTDFHPPLKSGRRVQ